ncbi:MAG: FAD-dependent oxidoreductase [Bilifractor sp.]
MKTLIIGGVAAGTKAAAKLKRLDRKEDVEIVTESDSISYAGCGLPYYIGGVIAEKSDLIVNSPEKFQALTGVQVTTGCRAVHLDPAGKKVTLQNLATGERFEKAYDRLILATGARPFVPDVPGTDREGVFTVRTPDDAEKIRTYIQTNGCRTAVVVGAGFIGLEVAENLMAQGLRVTVVDLAGQILPGVFDPEMADFLKRKLQDRGLRILTGAALQSITGETRADGIVTSAGPVSADVVILSMGIRPATEFLKDSGLEMAKGTILVDPEMKTNLPDVYTAGDCAEVFNRITGKPQWSPMGSTANITGRLLACDLEKNSAAGTGSVGGDARSCETSQNYHGCLGTAVVRLADGLCAAKTGLTEDAARQAGFDPVTVISILGDKPAYYPGADSFIIKLIADRKTHRLLGHQVIGGGAVDKMNDIAVTGISLKARVEDFCDMDYSYAPPFSTAIHPFAQACCILKNKMDGILDSFTPREYAEGAAKEYRVIDAQPQPKIPGALWIDLTKVNGPVDGLGTDEKLLLVCAKGKRGYLLQNRLKAVGYTNTKVLEGGATFNRVKVEFTGGRIPPEEIRRVKGLGCLQDKRYPDAFNIRVITRNGKITAKEQKVLAEAAERYGSGEVTMTTRLTVEVQGVHYDRLQEAIDFLKDNGLQTGGTGSKVRPVVSCKGTTCQYGLLDTFSLSEKLHERFYLGYHDVVLPHKFKIAVGGCPNNCVKPDLNDIGIIGQRIPHLNLEKCRGCKNCQIEKTCPIHVAQVKDGRIQIDTDRCNHCGRCVGKCPFGVVEDFTDGYKIYLGGRWGKRVARGHELQKIFTSEEEVLDFVEKVILFYREEGKTGERFADVIDRLGFDYVQDRLLHAELDKTRVLKKAVVGGATC